MRITRLEAREIAKQEAAELHRQRCAYWLRGVALWLQERDREPGLWRLGARGL